MSETLASPKYRIEVRELGAPDDASWRTVDSAWTEKQRDRKIKKHAANFALNVRSLENIITPAPETPLSKLAPGMSVRDINTDTVLRVTYVYPAGSTLAFDWVNDDPAATQKTGTCPIEAIEYFDPIEVPAAKLTFMETADLPPVAPEKKEFEPFDPWTPAPEKVFPAQGPASELAPPAAPEKKARRKR